MVVDGVLDIEIEREDLHVIQRIPGDGTVPFKPAWENKGDFFFQSLGNGQAILNGDFGGLLPEEIDPFIDKLLEGGLIFQALHQHFYDLLPIQVSLPRCYVCWRLTLRLLAHGLSS